MGDSILAGAVILLAAVIITVSLLVRQKIRRFSQQVFGTKNLLEGFRRQEELLESTPKSVSAMTRMELPRIQRDFPEFQWPEWRNRCELQLKNYLEALEHRDLSLAGDVSSGVKDQLRLEIEDAAQLGIREAFDRVTIHKTEIARYEKSAGICRILVQSAMEYHHTLRSDRPGECVEGRREQHRYDTELVYVRRADAITGAVASVICPSCGAPVPSLGNRRCAYCGAAVEVADSRVWKIQSIRKGI